MTICFEQPLLRETPVEWGLFVINKLDLLLSDHAYCERKAAGFALGLLQRYGHFYDSHVNLSKLVREEMRHYELVLRILKTRFATLARLSNSGYAKYLRSILDTAEPKRHIQLLLIAVLIEARSCERFFVLARVLNGIDNKLSTFYYKLALAEKRHHMLYINIACMLMPSDFVLDLLHDLSKKEQNWLDMNLIDYRMHSGLKFLD